MTDAVCCYGEKEVNGRFLSSLHVFLLRTTKAFLFLLLHVNVLFLDFILIQSHCSVLFFFLSFLMLLYIVFLDEIKKLLYKFFFHEIISSSPHIRLCDI